MSTDGDNERWLSAAKIAKIARCHRSTVSKARRIGQIPGHLVRRHASIGERAFYDYSPEAAKFMFKN